MVLDSKGKIALQFAGWRQTFELILWLTILRQFTLSTQKGSLSNEALEQLDRSLRPSFIWLIFFLLKSLFWSSNLSLGTLKILYSPVVIRIEDLLSLIFDQTLVKWDRLCICLENQNTNVCKRTQVSHNLFPTTKISRTVYR